MSKGIVDPNRKKHKLLKRGTRAQIHVEKILAPTDPYPTDVPQPPKQSEMIQTEKNNKRRETIKHLTATGGSSIHKVRTERF